MLKQRVLNLAVRLCSLAHLLAVGGVAKDADQRTTIVSDCAAQELTIIDTIELALWENPAARVWLL
jgi:hypothetical protein